MDGSSMKYTLESFLPIGAFEHCGNRHIKLYGGGGGVIESIGNAVSDAASSVGDAFASIDPGPAIGDAGQAIDEAVNDVVPGGWAMVGAVALTVMSAGTVDLEGEVLAAEAAAEAGAEGAAAGEIAAEAGSEIATEMAADTAIDTAGNALSTTDILGSTGFEPAGDITFELGQAFDPSTVMPEIADYAGDSAYEMQGLQEGYESTANALGDVTNPDGSITSTFDDGSTITRMGTEVVSTTPAISDPIQLADVLSAANKARQVYSLANTANKLLNPSSPLTRATTLSRTANTGSLSGLGGLSDLLSGSSSTGGGALPGGLQATSLAAAPVTQGSSNMNINQLKQLYPQLANVDPRILSALTGKSAAPASYYTYGSGQNAGETGLTNQGQGGAPKPGYPSIASDTKGSVTTFPTASSPNASYNALSAAGLHALNSGALPGQSAFKDGGNVHVPQFKTGTTGHFVQGAGDGQSDDIPAMLADGEYVFDADTVAALGNGSSKAGALQLDKMRESIRKHKRSAPHNKIPPKAKSPLEYLKG